MLLQVLGFLVVLFLLFKLLQWVVELIIYSFIHVEERMKGRQFVLRIDDADINRTVSDALAAFPPGHKHLVAGALTGIGAIAAVPLFHWLYALWVRFIMLFGDSMADGHAVYAASLRQIWGYMPRVMINAVALALIGMYYAAVRRKQMREDRRTRLLFWQISSTEVFGTVLGWFLYLLAALLPRFGPDGVFNFAGMLTLAGGWVWVFSGVVISMYLRTGQNAILWVFYRYRWQEAVPAIVRMMTRRRLNLPSGVIQSMVVDEPAGAVTIEAQVDPIDADRLRDSLLAITGLHYPKVIALGPPPGSPVRIASELAPRMRPLPPRSFRRPQGPPKGYGAEANLLDAASTPQDNKSEISGEAPAGTQPPPPASSPR